MIRAGIVYRASFPSGKFYIGITVNALCARIKCHRWGAFHPESRTYNSKFSRAIRKYDGHIKWEIIHRVQLNILNHLEGYEIEAHDSYRNGYNSTINGKGISDKAMYTVHRRKKHSKRMNGENNPFFGKHHSPDQIKIWSRLRAGKKDSDVTRLKKSIARRGSKNPMFGKTRSVSVRVAISDAKKRPFNIIDIKTGRHHVVVGIEGVFDLAKQHGAKTGRALYNDRFFRNLILIK